MFFYYIGQGADAISRVHEEEGLKCCEEEDEVEGEGEDEDGSQDEDDGEGGSQDKDESEADSQDEIEG